MSRPMGEAARGGTPVLRLAGSLEEMAGLVEGSLRDRSQSGLPYSTVPCNLSSTNSSAEAHW